MVNRDVVIAKITNIKKNLDRLSEKQSLDLNVFLEDRDSQDIVLFNIQTAIQGCIDIAAHIISDNDWGVPGSLAGLFDVIRAKGVIKDSTADIMRTMVGFRNLIVHEYAGLDMDKVYSILKSRLGDFNIFLREISDYIKV
ncbi:MAG: DUF86 domain-containing protein [Candidatus Omnitrophota bacterium]